MKSDWLKKRWTMIVWITCLVAVGLGLTLTRQTWMPHARSFAAFIQNKPTVTESTENTVAHASPDTLRLSQAAWKNIGLVVGTVKPADFVKVVSVPATVLERPGRSQTEITAPMTGVVTQVYPIEREITQPGAALFDLRLTHEEVVTAQSQFLTQLQNLDVVNRELTRLQEIGEGVIPGKRIVEQKYEQDKVMGTLAAIRESLLLHGLSEQQIADIEKSRKVLRAVTVYAPPFAENHHHTEVEHQYHVQLIKVNRGESVIAGQLLGVLADHCLLYVEGKAFEDDARSLTDAAERGSTVRVVPVAGASQADDVLNLEVQSVSDQIDENSRALKFYLLLPNQMTGDQKLSSAEHKFVTWKYRPGQRMEVHIPTTDVLKNKIVLPSDAVVIEGPNAFVFEQNGDNFDRIDVQVLYRDKDSVVLENDGQLLGSVIAIRGAYQMYLALKNQSGGAVDPHAGHNH
jgi:multidrug resistance efflux pump